MPVNLNVMHKIRDLHAEVEKFKQWAPPYENTSGEWECEYEGWRDLWAAAESVIERFENGAIPSDVAGDLLYAIARDNETEHLRKRLVDAPGLLFHLAAYSVAYHDPCAKWQIAVSVAEANLVNAADLICHFLKDDDEYVRRRALLAFAPFSPAEAESIAILNLSDAFEYTRIAALHVLHDIGSSHFEEALSRLENDQNEYVRANVEQLRGAS